MDARLEKAIAQLSEASRLLGIAAENAKQAADGILAAFDGRVFVPIAEVIDEAPKERPAWMFEPHGQQPRVVDAAPAPLQEKKRIFLHGRHIWTQAEMDYLQRCAELSLEADQIAEQFKKVHGFEVTPTAIRHRLQILRGEK